ncbi:basic leucine-zipper 44 [Euphorbia peplus]|nr:basic leucine-zipper 44 [Euphorbia peplus]
MASSSGNSSGSSQIQNSGSEGNVQGLIEQRKRKRMLSNRESARRSRMRKQKHLDDLSSQVSQLRKDNNQICSNINFTTQQFLTVEAENSVLRAQMMELSQRLDSLNEILNFINSNNGIFQSDFHHHHHHQDVPDHGFINNNIYLNQAIMASPDMFQY